MDYSLEKITTASTCDVLLTGALKKKQQLERRRRNLGESIGNFAERIDNISNEQVSVQVLLEAFTKTYDALPEGSKYKPGMNVKIKRLELRRAQLEKQGIRYNWRSLLAKQLDYNRLDSRVSAIHSYITAVQNKRTALENAALGVSQAPSFSRPPARRQKQSRQPAFQPSRVKRWMSGHVSRAFILSG